MESLQKFQDLLRILFQFDSADLDFGIYRIMNMKRQVIERFISHDLPRAISDDLAQGALAEQAQAAEALKAARNRVLEALGEDALDAEGKLAEEYRKTPAGREYLEARLVAKSTRGREAQEAAVYNHLYAFFSRYYQDGDFISKRRYSKKGRYAIPYNGEEVYLHWANHDQYYVKTGEYFTDYTWKALNGVAVHFKLKAADVEQNNVKGEKRFFLPRPDETTWDETVRQLTIPFEFRPLNAQEAITYGQKNQQDAIIAQALEAIPRRLVRSAVEAVAAVGAEKRRADDGTVLTYLEYHLRQYTRRNTSDFFIHKDLRSFLSRELDFYLKNEVLNLEEMEAAGEGLAEGWFQLVRLIKKIGGHVIAFLAEVEDFQKMLWEKRKFVTETFYCITVGNMPEAFYSEIAASEDQWEEWKALFHIDEEEPKLFAAGKNKQDRRIAFLKTHPTLALDTRHFDCHFVDRLLAGFENLDEMTDGLLVHSENWQAVNLLREQYSEEIKCVYIDPPYNTDAGPIAYKNGYRSSSWTALMSDRLSLSRGYLEPAGVLCVTIDDYQIHELGLLIDSLMGRDNRLGVAVIRSNPSGRATVRGFSVSHEYGFFYGNTGASVLHPFPRTEKQWARFTKENDVYVNWQPLRKGGGAVTYRSARPKQFYPIYVNVATRSIRIPELIWDKAKKTWDVQEQRTTEETVVWPIDEKGRERVWSLNHVSAKAEIANLAVRLSRDGQPQILRRHIPSEGVLPRSWWDKKTYGAREHGTAALIDLFGQGSVFTFPKAPAAVQDFIWVAGLDNGSEETVLDYFAGSGTTGHAVINLNREDGGRRKFILVEMADYFDTVLLPRIKKVAFTPEWKDGKAKRPATTEEAERGPRLVKVVRLESYEDSLNNIAFDEAAGQRALPLEGYILEYMLKWESRRSDTLLNVEKLSKPFSYQLQLHRDGETHPRPVDLPETFNYLLGLNVQTRQVNDDRGRRYLVYRGATRDGRRVAVIWRETAGWTEADYRRDEEFVAGHKLAAGVDEVYVNGDSFIPNARALESVFKARMFAEVGA